MAARRKKAPEPASQPDKPLAVAYRDLDSLRPYDRNARTHSPAQVAQIAASIQEFGFTNPLLIDERGEIIAGHGRLEGARAAGLTQVPTITLAGLSEPQRRALRIADNRLPMSAAWDESILAAELADLKLEDFNLDLLGFDTAEMEHALNGWEPNMRDINRTPAEDAALMAVIKVRCRQADVEQVARVVREAIAASAIEGVTVE